MYGPGEYFFRGRMTPEEKRACAPSPRPGRNMLSAFTYYADFSMPIDEKPGNIVIKDCVFENVDRFLHYNFSGNETWQRYRPMENITFENINAYGVKMALNAYGRSDSLLELTLRSVTVAMSEDSEAEELIRAAHCKRIVLDDVKIQGFKGGCLVRALTEGEYVFKNVDCVLEEKDFVKKTKDNFNIKTV
jgi:hypothetical protein